MSDPNHFDERLAGRFEQEHSHLVSDAFVADTLRKVQAARRRTGALRLGVRVAALAGVVAASPWLITGVVRLNAVLDAAFSQAPGLPVALGLGVLGGAALLATRRRGR